MHARKAWLQGLSPKENRDIPPLDYARVVRLKQRLRELTIVLNGGLDAIDDCLAALAEVDGIMLGRTAYHEPYRLAELEHAVYGTPLPAREDVLEAMRPYVEAHLAGGDRLQHVSRHILGLFQGLPGARAWRRHLSENAHAADADWAVVEQALARMNGSRLGHAA